MQRYRSIREVLEALDWVRREMMHRGSPDFIRQRELERRVHHLASRLSHGPSPIQVSADIGHIKKAETRGKRFRPEDAS